LSRLTADVGFTDSGRPRDLATQIKLTIVILVWEKEDSFIKGIVLFPQLSVEMSSKAISHFK